MARTLEKLSQELTPALEAGDEASVAAIFAELVAYTDEAPQDVEALVGWGILVACEAGLECAGQYGNWFLETFPESVLPVKVEFAEFLAGSGHVDEATQLAREYLRLIQDCGHLEKIEQFANVRIGASKAFLILTAAHTEVGARSYSTRVLEHAKHYPLEPSFLSHYQGELDRLQMELADESNRLLNAKWEEFFRDGTHADELYALCESRECPRLARRVDLLEGHFRFRQDFRVDQQEILQLVQEVHTSRDSQPAQMLA